MATCDIWSLLKWRTGAAAVARIVQRHVATVAINIATPPVWQKKTFSICWRLLKFWLHWQIFAPSSVIICAVPCLLTWILCLNLAVCALFKTFNYGQLTCVCTECTNTNTKAHAYTHTQAKGKIASNTQTNTEIFYCASSKKKKNNKRNWNRNRKRNS